MSRILSMRLFKKPAPTMSPFTKLAVESVLNQIFLISTGLWSDDTACQRTFDFHFWSQAESLLLGQVPYSGQTGSVNSPVLGIPVQLFRLAMTVKLFYQGPTRPSERALSRLKAEIGSWEVLVREPQLAETWTHNNPTSPTHRYDQDVAYLMILVDSLLLEQVLQGTTARNFPLQAESDSWQIKTAVDILQRNQLDERWSVCFIGSWPVYTLGYLFGNRAGLQLVRDDLDRRWRRTRFSQVNRYRKDLEQFWGRSSPIVGEVYPVP